MVWTRTGSLGAGAGFSSQPGTYRLTGTLFLTQYARIEFLGKSGKRSRPYGFPSWMSKCAFKIIDRTTETSSNFGHPAEYKSLSVLIVATPECWMVLAYFNITF